MFFEQFVDEDLGCASYVVGDERAGEAVVVDPSLAVEPYLDSARRHGLWIVADAETCSAAETESVGNLKRVWNSGGSSVDWTSQQAAGEAFLRRAVEVKNVWVPYGDLRRFGLSRARAPLPRVRPDRSASAPPSRGRASSGRSR